MLFSTYAIDEQNSVMKYELKYKEIVIFRRFYANSVRSKDKQFYLDLKADLKRILVPYYRKSTQYDSQFYRITEMNKYDVEGAKRLDRASFDKSKRQKVKIAQIGKIQNNKSISESEANNRKQWEDATKEM